VKETEAARRFEELFRAVGPSLSRYARRLTGSADTAQDLVQEAFLALYREWREGREVQYVNGWLFSVVRYQAQKLDRARRRHPEDLDPDGDLDLFPSPDGPIFQSDRSDVAKLLDVLSERERDVLLLRLESLKYREIGAQLGISVKSVGTLLARALGKLRERRRTAVDTTRTK
jgi:RNA polymerase sigma factor (sigma-70 family)